MIKVLIQAEAGSPDKMRYNEKTLKPIELGRVSRPYPYPYGFIVATTAADGDNVDCYIFGDDGLKSGSIVDCEVVGLLDQIESGEPDHKVLAVVAGQKGSSPGRSPGGITGLYLRSIFWVPRLRRKRGTHPFAGRCFAIRSRVSR